MIHSWYLSLSNESKSFWDNERYLISKFGEPERIKTQQWIENSITEANFYGDKLKIEKAEHLQNGADYLGLKLGNRLTLNTIS